MKKLIQVLVRSAAMFAVAPYLFGTPLYHWMVFVPILVGTMYAVALLQHWLHWRRRG